MDEAGIGRQVGRRRSSGNGDGVVGARHVDSGDGVMLVVVLKVVVFEESMNGGKDVCDV